MTDLRKAAEMVLDELEHFNKTSKEAYLYDFTNEIAALRQALAQPEPWDTSDMAHRAGGLSMDQEPVAWLEYDDEGYLFLSGKRKDAFPVFTAPPSKPWVSLTDEDFDNIYKRHDTYDSFARAIEAKLKEKNGL